MSDVVGSASIEIVPDVSGFSSLLDGQLGAVFADFSSSMSEAMDTVSTSVTSAATIIESALGSINDLMSQISSTSAEASSAVVTGMDEAGSALGDVGTAATDAGTSFDEATTQATNFTQETGKNMLSLGDIIKGVAIGTLMADAAKSISGAVVGGAEKVFGFVKGGADDVHEAFRQLRIETGKTGPDLKVLEDSVMTVFRQTSFAATDVATGLNLVQQRLGVTGSDAETLTLNILKLAKAAGMEAAPALESMTTTFKLFHIPVDQAATEMDRMLRISQATGVDLGKLVTNVDQIGPRFKAAGMTMDETAVIIGQLSKAGVPASQMISALMRAQTEANKSHITAKEALQKYFDEIKNAPTTVAAAALALKDFGPRAGPMLADQIRSGTLAISDLVTQVELSGDTLKAVGADVGSFSGAWEVVKHNLTADISVDLVPLFNMLRDVVKEIGPSVEALGTALGTALTPVVATLGPLLTDLAPKLGTLIESLAPLVGTLATGIVQMAEGIIPLLSGVADALTKLFIPLVPMIVDVVGVISGALLGAIKGLLPIIEAVIPVISGIFETVVKSVADLLTTLTPIIGVVASLFGSFLAAIAPVATILTDVLSQIAGVIASALMDAVTAITPVLPHLADAFAGMAVAAADLVVAFAPLIPVFVEFITTVITQISVPMWQGIASVVTAVAEAITNFLTPLLKNKDSMKVITDLIIAMGIAWGTMQVVEQLIGPFEILTQVIEGIQAPIEVTNALLEASPWAIAAGAIALVAAAAYLAYQKFDWFRAGIDEVAGGLHAAFDWLMDNKLVLVIAGVATALVAVVTIAPAVVAAVQAMEVEMTAMGAAMTGGVAIAVVALIAIVGEISKARKAGADEVKKAFADADTYALKADTFNRLNDQVDEMAQKWNNMSFLERAQNWEMKQHLEGMRGELEKENKHLDDLRLQYQLLSTDVSSIGGVAAISAGQIETLFNKLGVDPLKTGLNTSTIAAHVSAFEQGMITEGQLSDILKQKVETVGDAIKTQADKFKEATSTALAGSDTPIAALRSAEALTKAKETEATATKKVNDLKKAGAPAKDVTDAQRDLESATLDVLDATKANEQAQADLGAAAVTAQQQIAAGMPNVIDPMKSFRTLLDKSGIASGAMKDTILANSQEMYDKLTQQTLDFQKNQELIGGMYAGMINARAEEARVNSENAIKARNADPFGTHNIEGRAGAYQYDRFSVQTDVDGHKHIVADGNGTLYYVGGKTSEDQYANPSQNAADYKDSNPPKPGEKPLWEQLVDITMLASGGIVDGLVGGQGVGDVTPAMLTPGEGVLPLSVMNKLGSAGFRNLMEGGNGGMYLSGSSDVVNINVSVTPPAGATAGWADDLGRKVAEAAAHELRIKAAVRSA